MNTARSLRSVSTSVVAVWVLALVACGGNAGPAPTSSNNSNTPNPPAAASVPVVQHVAVVMLENEGFTTATNASAMPYLNSLIQQGGLATNYFATAHPSLPNYFMLTTGQTLVTDDISSEQDVDNVVRRLAAAGKTWKAYFQSLPSPGYIGDDVKPYVKHHNPFAYFSDVVNSTAQQQNIVPLSQLAADASAGTLPNYIFIVPDDAHAGGECPDGSTSCDVSSQAGIADSWLHDTLPALLSSSAFQQSGIAVVTFDEANPSDATNGGGHVATVLIGTKVKAGYQSATAFQHASTLRFTLDALGVSGSPGKAAQASSFAEFFNP